MTIDLASAAPVFEDAKCVGQHDLFDAAEPGEDRDQALTRLQEARTLCRSCPALAACGDWLQALPRSQRPGGVVAGRVVSSGVLGRQLRVA